MIAIVSGAVVVVIALVLALVFLQGGKQDEANNSSADNSTDTSQGEEIVQPDMSDPEYRDGAGVLIHQPWAGISSNGAEVTNGENSLRENVAVTTTVWPGVAGTGEYLVHPASKNLGTRIEGVTGRDMVIPFWVNVSNPSQGTVNVAVNGVKAGVPDVSTQILKLNSSQVATEITSGSGKYFSDKSSDKEIWILGYVKVSNYITSEYPDGRPLKDLNKGTYSARIEVLRVCPDGYPQNAAAYYLERDAKGVLSLTTKLVAE